MNLSLIDNIINSAIREGLFSGAALSISLGSSLVIERYYGRHSFVPWIRKIDENSIFDLASLTKPIGTTLGIALLITEKKVSLTDNISSFYKHCPKDKAKITISQLLSHTSGLPPWLPLYKKALDKKDTRKEYEKSILTAKLSYKPGASCMYSDLGFILLGFIIEKVSNMPLLVFFEKKLFKPSGVNFYVPSYLKNSNIKNLAVPTGYCHIRKRQVVSEVNDLNAAFSSHFLGHAGLFSNLQALNSYLKFVLDVYKNKIKLTDWINSDILKKMFTRLKRPANTTFALGFDTPSEKESSAGKYFSKNSIGHLGYTGTSFWIDLDKDIIIIFLSNRTFPYDKKEERLKMKVFRSKLHDEVMKAVF